MATSETTNLQLVKYGAGTDNFIRTDYNGNLDKIDTFAGNTNEAISNLDSESNSTKDILASAVSATGTMAFKAAGSSYTGTVPRDGFKYGMFIVETRNTNKSVVAIANDGGIATNYYNGSSWGGWQELALKSELTKNDFDTAVDLSSYTSTSMYTFPSDGYVYVYSGNNENEYMSVTIRGSASSSVSFTISAKTRQINYKEYNAVFVRKGMRAFKLGSNGSDVGCKFVPLK